MDDTPDIATLAALLGDPARARMLTALMDGRALTATELALEAGVAPSTASSHLGRLCAARLLAIERQGRHRYFRLSGQDVAELIEVLMGLAARTGQTLTRTGPKDSALRSARVCYDHLAGDRGVRMLDSLLERGLLSGGGMNLKLTEDGERFLQRFAVQLAALADSRRPLCRPCLDWSERRSHLGGSLGAALLSQVFARGWAKRETAGRAVVFSGSGAGAFSRVFPLRS